MPKAVVVHQTGGPEVLQVQEVPEPKELGSGQVLLRQTAIGINFMDTYYRSGLYKNSKMPFIPGNEACGVVEAVGEDVEVQVGQRVVYPNALLGSYSERRRINVRHLCAIPDEISDDVAVAAATKGMVAHMLIFRTFRLQKGDTILVHAAAGGVGHLLCQWANHLGANVIGTVSTPEKASFAKSNGCSYPIVTTEQNFVEEVAKITDNEGVNVVYDSVGKDTFKQSLECIKPLGLMACTGQSSGIPPNFNVMNLSAKGIFVTRPSFIVYKRLRLELVLTIREVFEQIKAGVLRPSIGNVYSLDQIPQAHSDLHARKTKGSNIVKL